MNARHWRRFRRRSLTAAHDAIEALGAAGQRLAERLAYRPREVVVVALLAAGVFGGLAVERWRSRHPVLAERLEAQRPRPATPMPASSGTRSRSRGILARCEQPGARAATAVSAPRLDLNRATPGELARVAGISWRLAARIVAARDAFEGAASPGASLEETPSAPTAPDPDGGAGPPATPGADPEPESP
jgi:hypothetical protein